MPRASLTEDYRTGDQADLFASLALKTGEYARLLLPVKDGEVWYEWVHTFRAPLFDDAGPVMEDKKRKDGSTYKQVYATEFVGGQTCLGDHAIIEGSGNGLDVVHCPACASAAKGTRGMTPERRWAVPVIRYKCVSRGSTELLDPPMAEILVWAMTQRQYNMLLDVRPHIRNLLDMPPEQEFEWKAADVVVWCEEENFKRLVFQPPLRPGYRNPEVSKVIARLWGNKANRPTDEQLRAACGRASDRDLMMTDVSSVEAGWRKIDRFENGQPVTDPLSGGPVSNGQSHDTDDALESLLNDHPGGLDEFAPPGAAKPAAGADPFADDPFADTAPAAAGQKPAEPEADPFSDGGDLVPASAAAPAPAREMSFDELLAD